MRAAASALLLVAAFALAGGMTTRQRTSQRQQQRQPQDVLPEHHDGLVYTRRRTASARAAPQYNANATTNNRLDIVTMSRHHTDRRSALGRDGSAFAPREGQSATTTSRKRRQQMKQSVPARLRRSRRRAPTARSAEQTQAPWDVLARQRREACPNAKPTDKNVQTHSHTFGNAGTLIMEWVDPIKPHVLALEMLTDTALNLFYSGDGGKNYAAATGVKEKSSAMFVSNGPRTPNGDDYMVYVLPENQDSDVIFVSKDSGKTFKALSTNGVHFEHIKVHPEHPAKILCFVTETYEPVVTDAVWLYEESKGFTKLKTHVLFAEWLERDEETMDKVDTILMTRFEKPPTAAVEGLDLIRWESPFTEKTEVVARKNCYMFEQIAEFLFVTELPSAADPFNEKSLWVSKNEGYSFAKAKFPVDGRENHYHVVDASEGMALVALQHTITKNEGVFSLEVKAAGYGKNFSAWKDTWTEPLEPEAFPTGELYFDSGHSDGCNTEGMDKQFTEGKIVIFRRGTCSFGIKMLNAELFGAIGVIIINSDDSGLRMSAPSDYNTVLADIPGFMVTKTTGNTIINLLDEKKDTPVGRMIEVEVKERRLWSATNLYLSDSSGVAYTLSLKNVEFVPQSQIYQEVVDVYKVNCQPGTYIANYNDPLGNFVTLITFNKGSHWARIQKPVDLKNCRDDEKLDVDRCSLHLGLETGHQSGIPLPQSTPQASCIILANGNVGETVAAWAEQTSLYVSEDGGLTWRTAEQGPHNVRILQHGSMLVSAPLLDLTDSISYSYNRGQTWEKKVIIDSSVGKQQLQGVIAEPTSSNRQAFVYYKNKDKWVGVAVDFSDVLDYHCGASAMENYYPDDATSRISGPCLLGTSQAYQRSKQCNLCYVASDFTAASSDNVTHCYCTEFDFMCAPGFYRKDPTARANTAGEDCVRDTEYTLDGNCAPDQDTFRTPHYMTIPGDGCLVTEAMNEQYLAEKSTPCARATLHSKKKLNATAGVAIAIVILVVLVGACAAVLYVSSRSRAAVIRVLGVEEGCLGSCGRVFASCKWFRGGRNYQYSQLYEEAQEWSDDGGLDDDDDLLFGIEDATPHLDDSDEDASNA
eukprot:m.231276 g.231276  ORF g.231276 m.231276 type:complete len:1095 (+) comp18870_c0_seq1:157-3441(+)